MIRWLGTLGILLGLAAVSHAATVQLSWEASTTTEVTGYRMYYGTTTGVYTASVDAGLSLTGAVGGLTPGTTYYMAVKAYIATGQESLVSNQVTVPITVIPIPATPLTTLIMPRMHSR